MTTRAAHAHSSHPPPPSTEAVKALFLIELKLAALRDKLYIERMEEAAEEEQMLLDGMLFLYHQSVRHCEITVICLVALHGRDELPTWYGQTLEYHQAGVYMRREEQGKQPQHNRLVSDKGIRMLMIRYASSAPDPAQDDLCTARAPARDGEQAACAGAGRAQDCQRGRVERCLVLVDGMSINLVMAADVGPRRNYVKRRKHATWLATREHRRQADINRKNETACTGKSSSRLGLSVDGLLERRMSLRLLGLVSDLLCLSAAVTQ